MHGQVKSQRSLSASASCLRFTLSLANMVLASVGVVMMLYALFVYCKFQKEVPGSDPSAHLPALWFVYAMGGAGCFTFITAVIGFGGASTNIACCLSVYAFMLVIMLALQLLLSVALFTSVWELPADPTQEEEKVEKFIADNQSVCKWGAVVVLAVEVLCVASACCLNSIYQEMRYRMQDAEEEDDGYRSPLLERTLWFQNVQPTAHSSNMRNSYRQARGASPAPIV